RLRTSTFGKTRKWRLRGQLSHLSLAAPKVGWAVYFNGQEQGSVRNGGRATAQMNSCATATEPKRSQNSNFPISIPSKRQSRSFVCPGIAPCIVGAARFELTTPCPPDKCANQAALRPGRLHQDFLGARCAELSRLRSYFKGPVTIWRSPPRRAKKGPKALLRRAAHRLLPDLEVCLHHRTKREIV